MKRSLTLLAAALALGGCATFTDTELSQVRSRGVSSSLVAKLDRGSALTPAEVIELNRRHVPETWIVRQLEDHGVDSLVSRSDIASLRRVGVHPAVVAAVVRASDRFADEYRYPDVSYSAYYGDPYFGAYDPWYWSGGVGATFVVPLHGGHHHHRHHHRH